MSAIRTAGTRLDDWPSTDHFPKTAAEFNAWFRRDRRPIDYLGERCDEHQDSEAKLRAEIVAMEQANEGEEVSEEVLSAAYERLEQLGGQVEYLEVAIALLTEIYEGRMDVVDGPGPDPTLTNNEEAE